MNINFWETDQGRSPVFEFIQSQDPKAAARVLKDIDRLEQQGLKLLNDPNKLKKLKGHKNIYEIKTYCKGIYYRILFTILRGEIWLLEGFKKKSNDTQPRYIATAITRKEIQGERFR